MRMLLCESNTMCYGSSTALLSILEKIDFPCVCLVHGITKEIISKSSIETIEVDVKNSDLVKEAIKEIDFDAVLVVSNTANLSLYRSMGKKIFFVHIHYFFPNANSPLLQNVDLLFIQRFWNNHIHPFARVIGPLVKFNSDILKVKSKIVVNLGGGESRFIKPGINSNYAIYVLDLILAMRANLKHSEIIICGGEKVISTIELPANQHQVSTASLSHDEYLDLLEEAEILISAPGLNSIFEALFRKIPIVFLPPQNISQVYQLDQYEKAGLTICGLNFPLPNPDMNEEQQTEDFISNLQVFSANERIQESHLSVLIEQLSYIKSNNYRHKVETAIAYLGKPSIDEIVNTIKAQI